MNRWRPEKRAHAPPPVPKLNLEALASMKQMLVKGFAIATLALGAWAQSVNTVLPSRPGVLTEPFGVAVDDHQNIYLSDGPTHSIYRFVVSTGELRLLTGTPGEAGSLDGTLKQAHFSDPKDILFARNGLVVADQQNRVIRFINLTSGQVSTLAGAMGQSGATDGPAADARFRLPRGLASDADGNIYISDFRAGSIRKLDTNNVVTTLATGLNGPSGLSVASNGKIYIAERTGNRISVLDPNGTLSAFAGTGGTGSDDALDATEATFNFPEDVLWLGSEFGLMVSDSANHTLRRIYFNETENVFSTETYAGIPESPGLKDGDRKIAQFHTPAGLTPYATGFLIVDQENQAIRQILTSPTPPKINNPQIGWVKIVVDPESGVETAVLEPVTDATFENDVVIAILGDPDVQNHFTVGPAKTNLFQPDPVPDPTLVSPTAPKFINHSSPKNIPPTLSGPLPALSVKAISTGKDPAENRTPSDIVQATFRFEVATPNINSTRTPGALVFTTSTENATMWYTISNTPDAPDPTNGNDGPDDNPNSLGPLKSGDSIPLVLGKEDVIVKVRGFRENYKDSGIAIAEFSPSKFLPNRITFGFEDGEASSDFVASAGQRFYAPVTLSLLPNSVMYGLQFNLTVSPDSGSVTNADYGLSFQSMLAKDPNVAFGSSVGGLPDALHYTTIPPSTVTEYKRIVQNFTNVIIGSGQTNTNVISITNNIPVVESLVFTNLTENLLGVGWLERFGGTNLYNTKAQTLISYSIPHDNVFLSGGGKVVPGSFSFVVPNKATLGATYTIKIGRPSATADGVSQDIFLQAPYEDDISPLKAIQKVTVGNRPYIVGDVAPFRWFNAGDFGDTNILNNDLIQIMEAVAYGWNLPPEGSDFEDAMDSCCVDTNGNDLSGTLVFRDGNDPTINQIAFGDGKLNVADIWLSFRRSLDPSLNWYARYWSNGVRQAVIVSNVFHGDSTLAALPKKGLSTRDVAISDTPPSLSLQLGGAETLPGGMVQLPLIADITGDLPIRALSFNAVITTLDGQVSLTEPVEFIPSPDLGSPTFHFESSERFSGVWLDTSRPGVSGDSQIGLIQIKVPTNATIASAYQVHLDRVSASPNGIFIFPQTTRDAYITMKNRAPVAWTDEITDDWRVQYFGSTLNAQSAPDADPDGDGLSNLAEFRAGTSPIDAADALRLQVVISTAGGVKLRWSSVSGKRYVIETCGDLGSKAAWSSLADPVDGTGQVLESARPLDAAHQFYRVRLAQ
jgi:hypothetical protein